MAANAARRCSRSPAIAPMRAGGSTSRRSGRSPRPSDAATARGAALAHPFDLVDGRDTARRGPLPRADAPQVDREVDARRVLVGHAVAFADHVERLLDAGGVQRGREREAPLQRGEDASHRRAPQVLVVRDLRDLRHQQVAAVAGRRDAEIASLCGLAELVERRAVGRVGERRVHRGRLPRHPRHRDHQQRAALGRRGRQRRRDRRRHRSVPHQVGERQRGHGVPSLTRADHARPAAAGDLSTRIASADTRSPRQSHAKGHRRSAPPHCIRLAGVCSLPVSAVPPAAAYLRNVSV